MIGSKLDIFKKEWLDVVFQGRNREYGAYELRKLAPKATNRGLLVVIGIVAIASFLSVFGSKLFPKKAVEAPPAVTEVTLEDLEEIKPPEPPEEEPLPQEPEEKPQQVAMDVPKEDLVRFPEPKVAPANKTEEEVAYHKEVIKEVQNALIPDAQNAQLKSLLQSVLPVLQQHLSHAEMVQKEVK